MISHKFISKSSNRSQLIPIKPPRNYWTVYVYIAIPIKPRGVWLVYWQMDACLTSINISFLIGALSAKYRFSSSSHSRLYWDIEKGCGHEELIDSDSYWHPPPNIGSFCRSFLRPLEPDLGQTWNGNLFVTWCNAMKKTHPDSQDMSFEMFEWKTIYYTIVVFWWSQYTVL